MFVKECEYRLPCGRCDKYNKDCDAPKDYNPKFNCNHKWLTKIVESDYVDDNGNKYCVIHQSCIYCGAYDGRMQMIEPSIST